MLPPIPPSRRARLDVRDLHDGGGKSSGSPSSPSSNLPSVSSHPTPGPPGFPGSSDGSKSLPGVPEPSSPSSGTNSGPGSGSGSSSGTGTGTSVIPNSTAKPPPASTSSSSSSSTQSGSTPIIFINGAPVPLLAIVLPIVFLFLALFLGSLFYFYRKARKSGTPPRHARIFLDALLIATFLWIPVLLVKLALSARRRRQRRGTLIVAGDANAAYSKLEDTGGAAPPMARTPSPADAEFLGLYGRYAPQPPMGVVVLRPAHGMMPGRYEPFAAPPPYDGPRTGRGAGARGAGEDEITAVGTAAGGRPATALAEMSPLAGPGRVR
ncbi:hypothetical protein B0T18DRAFT_427635 [Schizothecium vesticola]|uniref:Uncharacterized protein n=1 Tax=Schizothecium vesticola TaxID=314040 RepID=A0AA40F282_9PEZI|nr:hypothetical protein B0T18DRAFT_427635 [Schizothecium vesticola]